MNKNFLLVLSTNEPIINCLFQIAIFGNPDLPNFLQLTEYTKSVLWHKFYSHDKSLWNSSHKLFNNIENEVLVYYLFTDCLLAFHPHGNSVLGALQRGFKMEKSDDAASPLKWH